MKKKMMAVLLAGMMVLAVGCGKKGSVTVGEYKGLALTSVSQAEVDEQIAAMLEQNAELVAVDRAAEEGDTVNINYVGLKDGVAFEGGTDDSEDGFDLELGSNSFIDGFEDGLIGVVAGEKRDLNLTFPENYGNEELAGQAVVFQVTVNEVKTSLTPKLTDEFIAEKYPLYPTVAEYTKALHEAMNLDTYYEQITEQLMASSEAKEFDEARVAEQKQRLVDEYSSYASYYGAMYGLDAETSIMYVLGFESYDAFEEEMGNCAYEVVKSAMIIEEIAVKENIEVTEEIFNTKVAEYAESYGYEDAKSFMEANSEDAIKDSIRAELVMEFIIDNAVITEGQ